MYDGEAEELSPSNSQLVASLMGREIMIEG
jgi:hypothetical protein